MKITIGIPFYNAGRYLASSIRSVLGQTYSGFELILSDDGSTDGSLQIAESFNDPRIRLVSDGANRGIAFRLNEQISLANGTFFARMDADDLMFPDRIEKQLSFLERYGYDVTGTQAVVIDHNNEVMGLRTTTIPKSRGELLRQSRSHIRQSWEKPAGSGSICTPAAQTVLRTGTCGYEVSVNLPSRSLMNLSFSTGTPENECHHLPFQAQTGTGSLSSL